jgi:hypothetical protein
MAAIRSFCDSETDKPLPVAGLAMRPSQERIYAEPQAFLYIRLDAITA